MTVILQAPAKINMTLEVLGKREDGYHDLQSVIQTVSLYDVLTFDESSGTGYYSDLTGWLAERSLVPKAVELFRERTGKTDGISIRVEKRIPMMAGLGGDSSDAAAVLLGLNEVWEAGLPPGELHAIAEKLGSDVPFFLYGGTAFMAGRGEKVTVLQPLQTIWLVLVIPDIPVKPGKTGRLFEKLTSEHYTHGEKTGDFIRGIESAGGITAIYNVFENVAFSEYEGLADVWNMAEHISGIPLHLAGAGPVMFMVTGGRDEAEKIRDELRKAGISAVLAKTVKNEDYQQDRLSD